MAKIDYEFDLENKKPDKTGIYLRLVAIFLVVAALTAAIVWFLIPKSEDENTGTKPQEPTELVEPQDPAENETATTDGTANGTHTTPPGTTQLPETTPTTTIEPPQTEPVEPVVPEPIPADTTPTLEPEKGKPWIGDPIIDRPDVPVTNIPTDVRPSLDAEFNRAEQALSDKKYREAADAAGTILAAQSVIPFSTEWRQAATLLTEANLNAFDERAAIEGTTVLHVAKPGDSYSRIAAKYNTTIEAIKHYNRIAEKDNNLRISQKLLIYPGPWKITVHKNARVLELYHRDKRFAVFDIGIGRLGKTPTAEFVISTKLRNPDWYSPDGKLVRYGDPDNPLGTRFLKLAPTGTPDRPLLGYGIHGTKDDANITRSLSNGCIRMRNADVETLYIIVPGLTPVEITE